MSIGVLERNTTKSCRFRFGYGVALINFMWLFVLLLLLLLQHSVRPPRLDPPLALASPQRNQLRAVRGVRVERGGAAVHVDRLRANVLHEVRPRQC